jgi:hypothetical protein
VWSRGVREGAHIILCTTQIRTHGTQTCAPSLAKVRVYEKAGNDYATRFDDAGLPEACVADMLRGRAVCEKGDQLLALQELFQQPFEVHVEGEGDAVRQVQAGGEVVTLELVRTKNKCAATAVGKRWQT